MSTDFTPGLRIFARNLFDGRLATFGVHEWVAPDQAPDDGQDNDLWVLLTSQDAQKRTLTDGQGNYLWVSIDDDGAVAVFTRYGRNDTHAILGAVAEAFETEIFSEDEPRFWGFETDEVGRAHERDLFGEKQQSTTTRGVRKLPARFRQVAAKATRGGGPPFTKFGRRSFIAGITIYREHQERPMKAQTEAEPKQSKGKHRPDSDSRAERVFVAARLARAIGRGQDVIYHGTRAPEKVLRSGKLIPNGGGVSFSRSPEIAAHFAYLVASELDGYLPALLVLDRRSLRQVYRLEPNAEDWDNDEEEEIVRRAINFRRHLLGVVRESDVSRVLGPPTNKFVPSDWSPSKWMAYQREARKPGRRLFRERQARVRDFIVKERERTGMENARSPVSPGAKSAPNGGPEEQ
jgi:hypothetical protein